MINFPKKLTYSKDDIERAKLFADSKKHFMNSYEGTIRGELAEIALFRELSKKYDVIENIEEKTHQYSWDLKVDGIFVDVKTSAGKTITVSQYTVKKDISKFLFPCYFFNKTYFKLIGILDGQLVKKLIRNSNFGGFFIWNKDIEKKSIQ